MIVFNCLLLILWLQGNIMRISITSFFPSPAEAKIQCFFHLSFKWTLQLIKGISNNFQNLLRYFNGAAFLAYFKIKLFPSETDGNNDYNDYNDLALYSKDLKALMFSVSASNFFVSSLEENHKLPLVSNQHHLL